MKPTVSLETAKRLAEAGFMPPEVVEVGQFYQSQMWDRVSVLCRRTDTGENPMLAPLLFVDWSHSFDAHDKRRLLFLPTATDIIKQMPSGTRLVWHNEAWVCAWDLDYVGASIDNREDECPHECAAKAFLAWKAGLE